MEVVFLRQAHRFVKKANKELKEQIKNEIKEIQTNPRIGKQLKGKLKPIRSHRFRFKKIGYRIAYTIKNNIIIITIASRENFYRDLEV